MPTFEQDQLEKAGNISPEVSSLPSRIFPIADVPEPKEFKALFEYQGFALDAAIQEKLGDFQYINISFKALNQQNLILQGERIQSSVDVSDLITYYNNKQIQSELLSAETVTSMYLQDNFATDTASDLIEQVASGLGVDITETSLSSALSSILVSVNPDILDTGRTIADPDLGAIAVGTSQNPNISDDIVSAMLLEQSYRNDTATQQFNETSISVLGKVAEKSHAMVYDNRIINDAILTATKGQFGAFSAPLSFDATSFAPGTPLAVQARSRIEYVFGLLGAEDYEFVVNPVTNLSPDSGEIGEVEVAGYIVEKYEVLPNGEAQREPFIISANDVTPGLTYNINDPSITLGGIYTYTLSTLAICKIRDVNNLDSGEIEDVEVILKSRPQTVTVVAGSKPADPPSDVNYEYDKKNGNLLIYWDFPNTNETSYIKGFQIFRRTSTDSPFEIIRQYEFNDTGEQFEFIDDVDFGLVVTLPEPLTFYIDEDFKKDKDYIYAICSITQDGATSYYSTQTKVRYSNAEKKLLLNQVSPSGAPKPYPNFYLNQELDVDIIKTSKSTAMTVYLDPDVFNLRIPGDENNDGIVEPEETEAIQFIRTNREGGKYIMQLINTDLLKEQRFEITIEDPLSLVDDLSGS